MAESRSYNRPVREGKVRETREAILRARYRPISMDAIAAEAGVQRRTISRHFPTKDELLTAFWPWLHELLGASIAPETPADIVAAAGCLSALRRA